MGVWTSEGSLQEAVLSFYRMDSRDQTEVTRLGSNPFYLLRSLTNRVVDFCAPSLSTPLQLDTSSAASPQSVLCLSVDLDFVARAQ